ncbi:hypothetical protein [Streptomyces lavendofoliae]|uniref:hypothetical protein n=1 Tax=Streptomyces lavendofoliae TaxID=67314 RepID=UPI003D935B71
MAAPTMAAPAPARTGALDGRGADDTSAPLSGPPAPYVRTPAGVTHHPVAACHADRRPALRDGALRRPAGTGTTRTTGTPSVTRPTNTGGSGGTSGTSGNSGARAAGA